MDGVFRKLRAVSSVVLEKFRFLLGFVVKIRCKVSVNKLSFSCLVTAALWLSCKGGMLLMTSVKLFVAL
jgi:hypothetical protein